MRSIFQTEVARRSPCLSVWIGSFGKQKGVSTLRRTAACLLSFSKRHIRTSGILGLTSILRFVRISGNVSRHETPQSPVGVFLGRQARDSTSTRQASAAGISAIFASNDKSAQTVSLQLKFPNLSSLNRMVFSSLRAHSPILVPQLFAKVRGYQRKRGVGASRGGQLRPAQVQFAHGEIGLFSSGSMLTARKSDAVLLACSNISSLSLCLAADAVGGIGCASSRHCRLGIVVCMSAFHMPIDSLLQRFR